MGAFDRLTLFSGTVCAFFVLLLFTMMYFVNAIIFAVNKILFSFFYFSKLNRKIKVHSVHFFFSLLPTYMNVETHVHFQKQGNVELNAFLTYRFL